MRAPIIVLLILSAFSQQAFSRMFPGYYLNTTGDTVRCEFKFKDWNITPELLEVSVDGKNLNLAPPDVKGFGIDGYDGYDDYTSREITYHHGNYTLLNAPDVFSDKLTTKQSFLKIVARGKYNLYELTETSRSYFFIEEDNKLSELVYRVKKENMHVEEDQRYKTQIFAICSKEMLGAQFSPDITNASYNSRSIVPIFRKLNEKISGVKFKTKKRSKTEFDVFIGAVDNKFPTAVDGRYTGANKFDGPTSVSGGVSFLYFTSTNFSRGAVGLSLGYNQYSAKLHREDSIVEFASVNYHQTTKYSEELTMNNRLLMFDLFGMYFVNPLNKVKVYVKGGFNTNIGLNSDNEIYIDYKGSTTGVRNGNVPINGTEEGQRIIGTKKMYFNIHGGLGINSGKHKIEFNYYTPGVVNVDILFKAKMMSVYYYYSLSK